MCKINSQMCTVCIIQVEIYHKIDHFTISDTQFIGLWFIHPIAQPFPLFSPQLLSSLS